MIEVEVRISLSEPCKRKMHGLKILRNEGSKGILLAVVNHFLPSFVNKVFRPQSRRVCLEKLEFPRQPDIRNDRLSVGHRLRHGANIGTLETGISTTVSTELKESEK